MNMKYRKCDVVFQEVPDEISVCFYMVGCPNNCSGCHSAELNRGVGMDLTIDVFTAALDRYAGYVSCVLFLGGEWFSDLPRYLDIARNRGLNTCLYTGSADVSDDLRDRLTYLKVGAYVKSLGGLDNPNTNQRFYNLITHEDITYKFWRKTT